VWVGRVEPAKDLISLLHSFAEIRRAEPRTRLRIVGAPAGDPDAAAYLAHCKALAAQLFPDEAAGAHAVGDNPVSFEEIGGPEIPSLAEAYACGALVVLSSVVEGFPVSLVEAMLCGRATVSTDVGAVVEVIGGTGLVVPPRNPRALAEACVALLRDPERRERLGAAARARALELFTVEQNITAFHGIYLEIVSHSPVRRLVVDDEGEPLPFGVPAEAHVPGRWTETRFMTACRPRWAEGAPVRATVPPSTPVPVSVGEGA
jgi:glycosyltransferase involved in cell wall biosynthesis